MSYNNIRRTPYDQLMERMYNPETVNLYPAPWPMVKTESDMNSQKKFCITDCGKFQFYPYKNIPTMNARHSDGITKEGFDFQWNQKVNWNPIPVPGATKEGFDVQWDQKVNWDAIPVAKN